MTRTPNSANTSADDERVVPMWKDVLSDNLRDEDADSWLSSSVIWQNEDNTVTLADIPHSHELAQQFDDIDRRRIISTTPLSKPYASTEPKSQKAAGGIAVPNIHDLILQRALQLALDEARGNGRDCWHWNRVVDSSYEDIILSPGAKREHDDGNESGISAFMSEVSQSGESKRTKFERTKAEKRVPKQEVEGFPFPIIDPPSPPKLKRTKSGEPSYPPASTFVPGTIQEFLPFFKEDPTKYDLVIMDPPWPNRSVRRAGNYKVSNGTADIKALLASIPLEDKLNDNALVGVWVTNKAAFHDMLIDGQNSLFGQWGIELVEEWVWLKITSGGEPVTAIDGVWRRPYEVLLLGRRRSSSSEQPRSQSEVTRRIILAVPDLHSRKPNLSELFQPLLPSEPICLEIFARNLTTGWTSWGDEVLKFQDLEHWTEKIYKQEE